MVMERIRMRKIKEVLRLRFENRLSAEKIGRCCNLGKTTARSYILRFREAGLAWPLSEDVTDEALEQTLFPAAGGKKNKREPLNYEYLVQEMKRSGVTLQLLWEEYKEVTPDGYKYAQFCNLYRAHVKTLNYSMRQEHKAGEKVFVDFGKGIDIVNCKDGGLVPTKLFVAVWGASNFMFAKTTLGEDLGNWIDVNIAALEYFGCCPKAIVPDNLKSGVNKACRYEPEINPTYADFARHYGMVIFPARPHRPKDKPKAENGVKLAKRWILAKLRNRVFYSVTEVNTAIKKLLGIANLKIMKRIKKSRKELFETLDKPNALPLSAERYEFAEWKKVMVNIDYHVCFNDHYYSVPYTLIRQELEIRAARNIIEIFKKGERICSHKRSYQKHKYTTVKEHMPKAHQQYADWGPQRILEWAGKYGPAVKALVEKVMDDRSYPEQAYRSCLGIIRLENKYSAGRLNKACQRALQYNLYSYKGVKNILIKGLDQQNDADKTESAPVIQHENIRGAGYFQDNLFGPSMN